MAEKSKPQKSSDASARRAVATCVSLKALSNSGAPPGTLNFPAGVAIGKDGMLYVANNSVCPSFSATEQIASHCDPHPSQRVRASTEPGALQSSPTR